MTYQCDIRDYLAGPLEVGDHVIRNDRMAVDLPEVVGTVVHTDYDGVWVDFHDCGEICLMPFSWIAPYELKRVKRDA